MKVYLAKHIWIKHLAVQDLTKLSFVDSKKVVRKLVVETSEKIGSPFIAHARIWGLGRWLSGKCVYMSARTSAPFPRTHANWEVTVSICNPIMSNWDVIVDCNPVCPRQMKKCRNPQNLQGQLACCMQWWTTRNCLKHWRQGLELKVYLLPPHMC